MEWGRNSPKAVLVLSEDPVFRAGEAELFSALETGVRKRAFAGFGVDG